MKIAIILILGIFYADSNHFAFKKPPAIIVNVVNLNNDKGQVILDIFDDKQGFPMDTENAIKSLKTTIKDGKAVFNIDELPPGVYAFAAVHDENDNGELDTNFLGMPTEGACASNNAKGFMGPPKYKDAALEITNETTEMELEMIYF